MCVELWIVFHCFVYFFFFRFFSLPIFFFVMAWQIAFRRACVRLIAQSFLFSHFHGIDRLIGFPNFRNSLPLQLDIIENHSLAIDKICVTTNFAIRFPLGYWNYSIVHISGHVFHRFIINPYRHIRNATKGIFRWFFFGDFRTLDKCIQIKTWY